MAFRGGRAAGRITRSARWGGLRIEPYDPNARDADGDGIVQEGTAWERPAGTLVLDSAGREIAQGQESAFRPRGLRIVQRDNLFGRGYTDVPYTPTYEAGAEQEVSGTATALSEHGGRSLREQGLPSIRDIVTPPQVEPTEEPIASEEVALPEPFTREEVNEFVENMNIVLDTAEEIAEEQADEREAVVQDRAELPYIVGVPGAKKKGDRPTTSVPASGIYVSLFNETQKIRRAIRAALGRDQDSERRAELEDVVDNLNSVVGRGVQDAFEAYEDKQVLVAVRKSTLSKILKSGRLKSQHEVGSSSAALQPEVRLDVEETQLGVPRDIDVKKRPIYGWVRAQRRSNGEEEEVSDIGTGVYGDINLRMRSDVKSRTTLTMGDSVGEGRHGVPMLSRQRKDVVKGWFEAMTDIQREISLSSKRTEDYEHGQWLLEAVGGGAFPAEVRSRIAQRILREHPELREFVGDIPDFRGAGYGHYVEAQIHGGLDVEDIEAIELPDDVDAEYRSEIEQMAEPLGIRVGTRRELDERVPVEQVAEEVPEPEVVPETVEEVAERTEKVKAKNKRILDRIKSVGGSWARIDQKFKDTLAKGGRAIGFGAYTPDELFALRRESQKRALEPLLFVIRNRRAPTVEDGFDQTQVNKFANIDIWLDGIDSMDEDFRNHLAETDIEDLLDETEGYAREYFKNLEKRVRIRVPLGRLKSMLKDGRYKTTHEVGSLRSGPEVRARLETQFGLPLDAPADLRPASGYVHHLDSIAEAEKQYKEKTGREVTEFSELDELEGSLDSYGDIELVLDDAVAGRTAVDLGDSLNVGAFPAALDSNDPAEMGNSILRIGNALADETLDRVLNFLRAGREGSLWKARSKTPWWKISRDREEVVLGGGNLHYNEALIAGSFDVDEIAEVRIHERATEVGKDLHLVTEPILGFENGQRLMESLTDEFFSREALLSAGLTEEEVNYLFENGLLDHVRPETFSSFKSWPASKRIGLLLRHRKAKEIEQMLREAGIKNIKHLDSSGLNPMDVASFGEAAALGDTVEDIRIAKIREEIVQELRKAAEKHRNPAPESATSTLARNIG